MEGIVAAALNSIAYIVIAVLGVYGGKKLVGPNQDKLIDTLKDLVDAQEQKIKSLEQKDLEKDAKITSLEKQVTELKALTIFQAKEIERLAHGERLT